MPQAHFRARVPLKTLPPSLPLLLQAACSALTRSLPLTRVAWRKPRVQRGLCKCCSNHLLGSSKKPAELGFVSGCEGAGRGPRPWTAEVSVTGGKELSQGAWGHSPFEGWPKEMEGRETEYEPLQQMRGRTNRFHPELASCKCDANEGMKEQKALY